MCTMPSVLILKTNNGIRSPEMKYKYLFYALPPEIFLLVQHAVFVSLVRHTNFTRIEHVKPVKQVEQCCVPRDCRL